MSGMGAGHNENIYINAERESPSEITGSYNVSRSIVFEVLSHEDA
jgi:hypothetical protein